MPVGAAEQEQEKPDNADPAGGAGMAGGGWRMVSRFRRGVIRLWWLPCLGTLNRRPFSCVLREQARVEWHGIGGEIVRSETEGFVTARNGNRPPG